MFRRLYSSTTKTVEGAAILLALSAIFTQIFGLLRDKLLAHLVGPTMTLDVYYSAFRVPDILFNTVATFFSATILLPFFVSYISKNDKEGSNRFIKDSIITFSFLLVFISILVYIFFPLLSAKLVATFPYDMKLLYVKVGRLLLLSPILLGLSNLVATITQHYKHFIIWSLAPLLYNIGIIIGILFYPKFGIISVAMGVVLGALMHFCIQIPVLVKHKFKVSGHAKYNLKEMLTVLKTAMPRTVSLSLNNLVMLILIAVAARMSIGSISIFTFSYTVQAVPLTLIGLSFSVAAFPILSDLYANRNLEEFRNEFTKTARKIFSLTIICSVVFFIFRLPLIDFLLGSGAFTAYHTLRTGWLLAIACFGMVPAGMVQLYLRTLYATGDTKRPFWASFFTATFTIITVLVCLWVFRNTNVAVKIAEITRLKLPDTFVLVLMFSVVASSIINTILLRSIVRKHLNIKGTIIKKDVIKAFSISLFSTLISFIFYKFVLDIFSSSFIRYGIFVLSLSIDAFLIYFISKKMGLEEVHTYIGQYINRLFGFLKKS